MNFFICFHSIESLTYSRSSCPKGSLGWWFDLPFSMPRDLIEHFDWPSRGIFLQNFIALRQKVIKKFLLSGVVQKLWRKFAYRSTDKASKSSPAMRWVNPPVAWMMHAGIERIRKGD